MASKRVYSEHLCQSTKHQSHADALTGAAERGYFYFPFPVKIQSIWGKSTKAPPDTPDWAIIVGINNPETNAAIEHTLKTATAATGISIFGEANSFELPAKSYIKVTSTSIVGSAPVAHVCYGMLQEKL